jgi:hypothetical protein
VDLFLNGRRVGQRRAGRRRGYLARFTVPYEAGTLTAVGYRSGIEVSMTTLRSAVGPMEIRLVSDCVSIATDGNDLIFAELAITGSNGAVEMLADEQVRLDITGPGELIGFGTAAPAPDESFSGPTCTTFRGRALAVIRPTGGEGSITITAHAQAAGSAELTVEATALTVKAAGQPIPLASAAIH